MEAQCLIDPQAAAPSSCHGACGSSGSPNIFHPVTRRGNCGRQTFFSDDDHAACRNQFAESCAKVGVAVWAWCLMPNHVHLILVPSTPESLRMAQADAHRLRLLPA